MASRIVCEFSDLLSLPVFDACCVAACCGDDDDKKRLEDDGRLGAMVVLADAAVLRSNPPNMAFGCCLSGRNMTLLLLIAMLCLVIFVEWIQASVVLVLVASGLIKRIKNTAPQ